jgi:hypothetical protein
MSENNEVTACYSCGGEYDSDDLTSINERAYCSDCYFICEACNSELPTDDLRGNGYCNECSSTCERCDDVVHSDYTYDVNGDVWCEYCRDNNSFYCSSCENSYPDHFSMYNVSGYTYCDSCFADNCYYCDDCDNSYLDSDPCECQSGNPRPCRCSGVIHDYSCKPPLVFHGNSKDNLYMGFELECQINSDFSHAAIYARESLAKDSVGIIKSDSSIGRSGFEIVTQPHTHAHYRDKSDNLWQTINKLRTDYEARSWDTDKCGLHIHISRAGFTSKAHLHRFMAFIYKNAEVMMKFAGRKSSYARFNDVWRFDEYDRPYFSLAHKLDPNAPTERYSAVNTQNRDTIELRFFRGTMNPSGVLSALDLAHAGVEYTRNLRLSDVKLGALQWDWFCDYVEANNGIYPDLYNRIGKVQSVDINKPVKLEA